MDRNAANGVGAVGENKERADGWRKRVPRVPRWAEKGEEVEAEEERRRWDGEDELEAGDWASEWRGTGENREMAVDGEATEVGDEDTELDAEEGGVKKGVVSESTEGGSPSAENEAAKEGEAEEAEDREAVAEVAEFVFGRWCCSL